MKFEAILFDCDGVLVDSEPITNGVLCTMLGEAGWARSLPDGRWGLGATTDGPIPEADSPPMQEPDR